MEVEIQTKHVSYNPSPFFNSLQSICENLEEDGWELTRIVHVHDYENVAVFQRLIRKEETEIEGGSYL